MESRQERCNDVHSINNSSSRSRNNSSSSNSSSQENQGPQNFTVYESLHKQSIWWKTLPFLYDYFLCTPLPTPSNICLPIPCCPEEYELQQQDQQQQQLSNSIFYKKAVERVRRLTTGCCSLHSSPPLDFLVNSESEVFIVRIDAPQSLQRSSKIKTTYAAQGDCKHPLKPFISDPAAYSAAGVVDELESPKIEYEEVEIMPGEIQIGDFNITQQVNRPSAPGKSAELLDIPIISSHLVRK